VLRLAPYIQLRTANLEWAAVTSLSCPRLLRAVTRSEAIEGELDRIREPLSQVLFARIHHASSATLRRDLLSLKRCVHNSVQAPRSVDMPAIDAELSNDSATLTMLDRWRRMTSLLAEIEARGEVYFRRDWSSVARNVGLLVTRPDIRMGLLMAQPRLFGAICRNATASSSDTSLLPTKAVHTSLAYLFRIASKPTPFSTFASVGTLAIDINVVPTFAGAGRLLASVFRLDPGTVDAIGEFIKGHREISQTLPVCLNETICEGGGSFLFVSALRNNTETFARERSEVLLSIIASPVLRALVVHLRQPSRRPLLSEVSVWLAESFRLSEDRVDRLLCKLLDCGFIRLSLGYASNSHSPVKAMRDRLIDDAVTADMPCVQSIIRLQDAMDHLASDDCGDVVESLDRIRLSMQNVLGSVKLQQHPSPLTQPIQHTTLVRGTAHYPRDALERLVPDLSRITKVLPLFNTIFPCYLRVRNFLMELLSRNPRGHTIMSAFDAFCKTYTSREEKCLGGTGASNPFSDLSLESAQLNSVRSRFLEEIRAIASASCEHSVELRADFFSQWEEKARPFVPATSPMSVAFVGRTADLDGCAEMDAFVVGKVLPGYGTIFARYALEAPSPDIGSHAISSIRRYLTALDPDSDVIEVIATLGSSGQIHPPVTRNALYYPGEEADSAAGRRIPWSDLSFEIHHKWGPCLVRSATGRRVLPVVLGTMSPAHYPPLFRFMACLGPSFLPDFSLVELAHVQSVSRKCEELSHYSRLRRGQIVLSPESWFISAGKVSLGRGGSSEYARFRARRRWASSLGLPQHVYVVAATAAAVADNRVSYPVYRKMHKPFYVDWDNYCTHLLFDRFFRRAQSDICVTEALPRPNGALRMNGLSTHASDIVVELWAT
jgi:hypothetical protein